MAKFREVQLNRRQALGVAGAAVVPALMVPVMRAAADVPVTGEPPDLPKSATANGFDFAGVSPQVVEPSGTITEATGDNFPVLRGNRAAVYFLTMKPGALREPHWHPDAWELDIPLSGRGRLGDDILGRLLMPRPPLPTPVPGRVPRPGTRKRPRARA